MNPNKIILHQTNNANLTNDICKELIKYMNEKKVVIDLQNGFLSFKTLIPIIF